MPRGDRTGPEGMGPQTGRGMGYCSGNQTDGFAQGRGAGGRGGFGGRFMSQRGFRNRYFQNQSPADGTEGIKAEASTLMERLENLLDRLDSQTKEE